MPAGFSYSDEGFWGTNSSIEVFVETLAGLAAARLGPDAPLAAFLREELEGFFVGKVVELDDVLRDAATRAVFVELLDTATSRLLEDGAFSDRGRVWVSTVMGALRDKVAGGR